MKPLTTHHRIGIAFAALLSHAIFGMFLDWVLLRLQNAGQGMLLRSVAKHTVDVETQHQLILKYISELETSSARLVNQSIKDKRLQRILRVESGVADQDTRPGQPRDAGTGFVNVYDPTLSTARSSIVSVHKTSERLAEKLRNLNQTLAASSNLSAAIPSIAPTDGYVSSLFGRRVSPMSGRKVWHRGVDIAARAGTPVVAPADGIVTYAGWKGGFGRMVIINHGLGITTRFAHNQKTLVKHGQRVKRGDEIATVGRSGKTTGSHLHYEVIVADRHANPSWFMQEKPLPVALAASTLDESQTGDGEVLGVGGDGDIAADEDPAMEDDGLMNSSRIIMAALMAVLIAGLASVLALGIMVYRGIADAHYDYIQSRVQGYMARNRRYLRRGTEPVHYWSKTKDKEKQAA